VVPLSEEVRMVPLSPTTTCDGLEVVVVGVSLLLLQEERRRKERMMSRCFIVYWFVLERGLFSVCHSIKTI
jgi:hypothetical protein